MCVVRGSGDPRDAFSAFERSYGGRQLSPLSPRAQLPFAWGRRPAVSISWSPASYFMRYANVLRTLVNHTLGAYHPCWGWSGMHSPFRTVGWGKAVESCCRKFSSLLFGVGVQLFHNCFPPASCFLLSGCANVLRTLVRHPLGALRPLLGLGWDAFPRSSGRTGERS